MKKFYLLSFLCLTIFFYSCNFKSKRVYILTDDINLYNIVDNFNLYSNEFKVILNYLNNEEATIFDYAKQNRGLKFDLIIGSIDQKKYVDYKRFYSLKNNNDFVEQLSSSSLFSCFKDYLEKNDHRLILYKVDFPSVVVNSSVFENNKTDFSSLAFDELFTVFKTNRYFFNNLYFFKFLPELSNMDELDYLFMFNPQAIDNHEKFDLDINKVKRAFDFYYFFNKLFNLNENEISDYIARNRKIDKKLYLASGVLSLDFYNVSEALNFIKDKKFKILFIKDMNNLGLKNNVIVISNRSFNKKEAFIFVKFLLSIETQKKLYETSISDSSYKKFLPIYKNILPEEMDSYISNLKSVNFFNNKLQKTFFSHYYKIKNTIKNSDKSDEKILSELYNF